MRERGNRETEREREKGEEAVMEGGRDRRRGEKGREGVIEGGRGGGGG